MYHLKNDGILRTGFVKVFGMIEKMSAIYTDTHTFSIDQTSTMK